MGILFTVVFFMALVALAKVASLRREVDELREEIIESRKDKAAQSRPVTIVPKQPAVCDVPPEIKPTFPPPATIHPMVREMLSELPPIPPVEVVEPVVKKPMVTEEPVLEKEQAPRPAMEFMLGGKAAAFVGAAILVMGVVFLVGYAMQHSWIGPGTRVILGLLSGGALVGIGYGFERRDGGKYGLLARALTGAGSALFYFVVFAAYGIYHLIGAAACGAGLFVSALAVFGLAMVYNSQAVGVMGVLGAFITPLLIGGEMEKGVFALVYVAVINIPVFLLGIRRKWQALYNLSFVFTVFYFFAWLDWIGAGEYGAGLLFAIIYFIEFAALGLLKLRCEQAVFGRRADTARLLIASLLLLGAVYWILNEAGQEQWMGFFFLLLALLHIGLAALARLLLRRFTADILAFLGGGLLFAVLALPAQLDGEWVSLGWAIEGAVLAWFAVRVKSRTLLSAASLIGLIGILKPLCYDVSLYTHAPTPFLNIRFGVGIISCGLLGVQGWLAGRFPAEDDSSGRWRDSLWWTGILAALIVFTADAFWTIGFGDQWAWLMISAALLVSGAVIVLTVRPDSSLRLLGCLLLALLPLQIIWFYLLIGIGMEMSQCLPFLGPVPWLWLLVLAAVLFGVQPRISKELPVGPLSGATYRLGLSVAALISVLVVLMQEIRRLNNVWEEPSVTVLWAVWAVALAWLSVRSKSRPLLVAASLTGLISILKTLFYDIDFYVHTPRPILNIRFGVGIVSSGLLGVQGWLAGRFQTEDDSSGRWRDSLWWIGVFAGLIVFSSDVFWTMGFEKEWAWLLISMALLVSGAVITLTVRSNSSLRLLGCLLLVLLPLQIIWFYALLGIGTEAGSWKPFLSPVPWLRLLALGAVLFGLRPRISEELSVGPLSGAAYRVSLTIASLISALMVLTQELSRISNGWAGPSITVLWAVWALTLTIFGLARRAAPYRFFGLILFGLTTLKVLLIDASALRGIERIAVFMATGILLLVLSFVYQKAAARFLTSEEVK